MSQSHVLKYFVGFVGYVGKYNIQIAFLSKTFKKKTGFTSILRIIKKSKQ